MRALSERQTKQKPRAQQRAAQRAAVPEEHATTSTVVRVGRVNDLLAEPPKTRGKLLTSGFSCRQPTFSSLGVAHKEGSAHVLRVNPAFTGG